MFLVRGLQSETENMNSPTACEVAPVSKPESHIIVQAPDEDLTTGYDPQAVRMVSLLAAGLVTWRIAWPLIARVVADQWLIVLLTGVAALTLYFIGSQLFKELLTRIANGSSVRRDIEQGHTKLCHWSISERLIKRHYPRHSISLSINSVTAVSPDADQINVTFRSGEIDRLPISGFQSNDQREAAIALLSAGAAKEDCTVAESEDTIELESCYSKESLKVLNDHDHVKKELWKCHVTRTLIFYLSYVVFMVLDRLANGWRPLQISDLILSAFLLDSTLLLHWLSKGTETTIRRFWRVGVSGFRFGTRVGYSWQETFRQWCDLRDVIETKEGLVLEFSSPRHVTLLPKNAVSLQTWNEAVHCIRELGDFPARSQPVTTF